MAHAASNRPAHMSIANLANAEVLEVQYNPTDFEENYAVTYARQKVPGLSHTLLQYTNTENWTTSLEITWDALTKPSNYDSNDIDQAKRFLSALCYPRSGQTSIRSVAPSRALFLWPSLISITTVITSLKIKNSRFDRNGLPTAFISTVGLEEIRDFRLTADDVRLNGSLRSNGGGAASVGKVWG